MATMKRPMNILGKTASIVLMVLLVIIVAFIFIPGWQPFKHHVIVTGSMAPEIEVGAFVVVDTRVDSDTLEEGDIISFMAEINETHGRQIVLHHIHEIHVDETGENIYRTIAANTDVVDDWIVQDDDVLGRYLFHVNGMGNVVLFLHSGIGRVLVVVNLAIILMLSHLFKKKKIRDA